MSKLRKILRSPVVFGILFLAALALTITGGIQTTRAALTYYSETYSSRVQLDVDIGVGIEENGEQVSFREYAESHDGAWDENVGALLGNLLAEDEQFQPGRTYPEVLRVVNTGNIDEYIRVCVYKYWLDEDGNKLQDLNPALIDLHFVTGDGWVIDPNDTTDERTTLYYQSLLLAGESTTPFADTLTVNGDVAKRATETVSTVTKDGQTFKTITTTYDFDGVRFALEADVFTVQSHNAADAVRSAWGVDPGLLGLE